MYKWQMSEVCYIYNASLYCANLDILQTLMVVDCTNYIWFDSIPLHLMGISLMGRATGFEPVCLGSTPRFPKSVFIISFSIMICRHIQRTK